MRRGNANVEFKYVILAICFLVAFLCVAQKPARKIDTYMSALESNGVVSIYGTASNGEKVQLVELHLINAQDKDVRPLVENFHEFTNHVVLTRTMDRVCHRCGKRGTCCKMVPTGIDENHPNRMVIVKKSGKAILSKYMKPFLNKMASTKPYVVGEKAHCFQSLTLDSISFAINGTVITKRSF
jgi:hypothetical protein